MKNPYHLLEAGNYDKAMGEYTRLLVKHPDDECLLDGYPFACLCLGRLEEALEWFQRSNEKAKRNPGCPHPAYLLQIGTVQWLLGRREEAVHTFKASVDGILDGTIEYADASGGAKQGLMLWYAGVSLHKDEEIRHAVLHLRMVASKRNVQHWPGPLAEFAIGKISNAELLQKAFATKALWLIRLQAAVRRYKRSYLSKIWFYLGVQARADGNEAECQRCMMECSRLGSSPANLEWHLAKAEVRQASPDPR